MGNIETGTIVRTVLLALAIINSALAVIGKSPLPFEEGEVEQVISFILMAAASVVSWWKNNSFTAKAIEADKVLHGIEE